MQYENALLTLAEIAVAIAGFAGVVGIFGRGHSRDDPRVTATRLRNLVETGLLTSALCILPVVLAESGLALASGWRLASALSAVGLAGSVGGSLLRFRRLAALDLYHRDYIASAFYILAFVAVIVLLVNALGLLGAYAPTVYVVCLLQPFGVAVLLFLRLLSAHFPTDSE